MKVSDTHTSRWSRAALLVSLGLGWALVVVGVATERLLVVTVGAAVVAIGNLIMAKALLEMSSTPRSIARLQESVTAGEQVSQQTVADLDALRSGDQQLRAEVALQQRSLESSLEGLRAGAKSITGRFNELVRHHDELMRHHDDARADSAAAVQAIDALRAEVAKLGSAHDTTRSALLATRALTDKLAERARNTMVEGHGRGANAETQVDAPLLSIAVPSFNRPEPLAELLASIADEVATCPPGTVEVCITDDASPDPQTIETAVAFAENHEFAALRIQPSNVGLERNVMAAGDLCRGEYLMLIGNDDLLAGGALAKILEDISNSDAPVLLYGKRRINLDGSQRPDVPGSIPIEIAAGETHRFDSMIDASRLQGFLSTFGFAGPMVVPRVPFLTVDPGPYLDLTMYARTAVLIEAFSGEPVLYHNLTTILHRTATPSHKHAESLGRREEEFMAGGNTRLARYYGTSLAATLQRLIDRGALDHETVAAMPERLMTDLPLVGWIARNRRIDPGVDERLGSAVVADADRFFAAQAALPSRQVQ